jgi:hypothetical protein
MGKTVESYRIALEQEISWWNGFARALRKEDREAFEELMDMCRRPYLNSKRLYHYSRQSVSIVKKFHSVSAPFLKQDLKQNVTVQNGSLVIVLTPKKRTGAKDGPLDNEPWTVRLPLKHAG